ncbi:LuxR C-terminal-related transcriptional regulator [uncultured Ezakiella sp.]|uniref:helix-turn-helix transcriptional regulator n=1 Tax=uncultured Ezakiella sp. TaxID=1637529 RepID=UPI0025F094F3|nr:LuxR C-terminal-related transcriptional regulator [uncultured Ezakiella sp.]
MKKKKLYGNINIIAKTDRLIDLFYDKILSEAKAYNGDISEGFDIFLYSRDLMTGDELESFFTSYQDKEKLFVISLDYEPRLNLLCNYYGIKKYLWFSNIKGNLFADIKEALEKVPKKTIKPFIKINGAETDIIMRYVRGDSLEKIAEETGYSKHTIKKYMAKIYEKIGIDNNRQLIQFAINLGLVDYMFYKDGCYNHKMCYPCHIKRCPKNEEDL